MIKRAAVLTYGAVAYLAFLATFVYAIGFLAGVGVPKGVDDGTVRPAGQAVLIDVVLLGIFAVQHSVMARPAFKRWWTRLIPPAIERSTYVAAATAVLALLLWLWQPLPHMVWSAEAGWARTLLWAGFLFGWALLLWSTFLISHFDLFGLRQVVARARDRQYEEPGFAMPWLYTLIRHPLMTGFLIAFWVTPDMSVGRLLFAAASTGYILIGVRLEEHDLKAQLGEPYADYLQQVPRFVPLTAGRSGLATAAPAAQPADEFH